MVWKRTSYLTAYDPETSETSQTQCLYLFRNIDLFDPQGCKSNISKQPGKAINFKAIWNICEMQYLEGALRSKKTSTQLFRRIITIKYGVNFWLLIKIGRLYFKKPSETLVLIYLLKELWKPAIISVAGDPTLAYCSL